MLGFIENVQLVCWVLQKTSHLYVGFYRKRSIHLYVGFYRKRPTCMLGFTENVSLVC